MGVTLLETARSTPPVVRETVVRCELLLFALFLSV
jgi:hypothetical protein